jgi:hypothetical protein
MIGFDDTTGFALVLCFHILCVGCVLVVELGKKETNYILQRLQLMRLDFKVQAAAAAALADADV